ncbi:MAG TPA: hypothetical protein VJR89_25670 [Polyangiales bacterium]|nr:hypothetical protein [Polyangiales bacterium]
MPKAKAKPKPKTKPKTAAHKAPPAKTKPAPAVDPRVVATIGLALHDESIAAGRDEQLQREASQWTILARARGVRSR